MLTINDLQVSYDGSRVLRGVNLTVPESKVVCLMGRNGVGKSTTLKSIMGLVKADQGNITLDGESLDNYKPDRRGRAGLGYVPQGRDIFPHLTVWENLKLGLVVHGDRVKDQVDRVFQLFPVLKQMLKRKGGVLSGGQQQQLAIGRALLTGPKVLILDEPTEGIQPNIIDQIGDAIRLLRRGAHPNEAGLLAQVNQSLKKLGHSEDAPQSPFFEEASELIVVLLRDGLDKHPAMFNRFAECMEALRKEQPTGNKLGEEIGSALQMLRGESNMAILLVEQYLDFAQELADIFYIMDRGAIVADGPIAGLTDAVVKEHLMV